MMTEWLWDRRAGMRREPRRRTFILGEWMGGGEE